MTPEEMQAEMERLKGLSAFPQAMTQKEMQAEMGRLRGLGAFPQAPQQQAAQPPQGLLARMGAGIQNFRNDPEKMARLQMGLNSMRLNPDQGIAASAANTIQLAQERKRMVNDANVTVQRLRAVGKNDLADMVEANPTMAKEIIAAVAAQGIKLGTDTETMRTRKQTALQLGYAVGTPEYRAILAGSSPTDVASKLEERLGKFRKEYTQNPDTKDFQKVTQAFGKIATIATRKNPTAAGDMSLIFNYMKMLDPGSTVREGEYATAEQATGVPNRIVNAYNAAMNGTRLNVAQRADFANTAQQIYDTLANNDERNRKFYESKMRQISPDGSDFLPEFGYMGERVKISDVPKDWPEDILDRWAGLSDTAKNRYLGLSDAEKREFREELRTQ